MNVRRIGILCAVGFLVSGSTAMSQPAAPCQPTTSPAAGRAQAGTRWRAATDWTDQRTGIALRLRRLSSGGLAFEMRSAGLDVTKTTESNGDFDLTLRADDDQFSVSRRADRFRVSRGGRSFDVGTSESSDAELDQFQQILAGSKATRRFRAVHRLLTLDTRCSGLGVASEAIDLLLGVLQGEPPSQAPSMAVSTVSAMTTEEPGGEPGEPSCYKEWAAEVMDAWNDYVECFNAFAFYNPLRQVCAFLYIIRVESAWFKLIGCSAIPIKIEACDVAAQDSLQ